MSSGRRSLAWPPRSTSATGPSPVTTTGFDLMNMASSSAALRSRCDTATCSAAPLGPTSWMMHQSPAPGVSTRASRASISSSSMVVVSTVLAVARIASRRWASSAWRRSTARLASVTSTTVAPAPMRAPPPVRTGK